VDQAEAQGPKGETAKDVGCRNGGSVRLCAPSLSANGLVERCKFNHVDLEQRPSCPRLFLHSTNSLNTYRTDRTWYFNNKNLRCCRETVQCSMLLNMSLSHSRSLKVIWNNTREYGFCKSPLVFHCNYVCILHCFSDIQRQIWHSFEIWVKVHSSSLKIAPFNLVRSQTSSCWHSIVTIALCCINSENFGIVYNMT